MHPQARYAKDACVRAGIPRNKLHVRTTFEWINSPHGRCKQYDAQVCIIPYLPIEELIRLTPDLLKEMLSVTHYTRHGKVTSVHIWDDNKGKFEIVELEQERNQ